MERSGSGAEAELKRRCTFCALGLPWRTWEDADASDNTIQVHVDPSIAPSMQLEATKWKHEQSGASGADPPCPPSA